jgi:transposase
VHKVLEEAGIKLSSVISDSMGVSGQAIIYALAAGEHDPQRLASLAHASLRRKHDQLVAALQGDIQADQAFLLRELLGVITALESSISHVEQEIDQRLHPFEQTLQRLEAITGVSRHTLAVLFAEVGWDLTPFPDAAHLASWAGMCPSQHESAGKQVHGRMRKGNKWLRAALVQAAHATSRTLTYLGEQYRRLKKRRGSKRAAIAVGHSILVMYYHMMKSGECYQEKGIEYLKELDKQRLQQHLVRRLQSLGCQVTIEPPSVA